MSMRSATLTAMSALSIVSWYGTASAAPCDAALNQTLQDAGRRIASAHPTKPGQARVFAADGAEYTAGAVQRLTAEVRLAAQACDRGEAGRAAGYLDAIQTTLRPPAG